MSLVFPEYLDELKQYSPTYTQWAGLEEELEEPLKGVASCVERCSKETEEQIHHLSEVLVPALHEYVLCAETLKVSRNHTAHVSSSTSHLFQTNKFASGQVWNLHMSWKTWNTADWLSTT